MVRAAGALFAAQVLLAAVVPVRTAGAGAGAGPALAGAQGAVTFCATTPANTTGCPTSTSTCCAHKFSHTGMGCCPFPDAVCCAGSYGLCCPSGTTCKSTGSYSGQCIPVPAPVAARPASSAASASPAHVRRVPPPPNLQTHGAPQVCTPGPMEPPSSSLPSAIIIGDSVSIGYTPHLIAMLEGKVQVQHAPSAGGGGADDTPYGKQCIVELESFIRTARYEEAKYDLITFNFGLHDMEYNSTDGAHSVANYTAQLGAIADRLVATKSKLLYVATTPFMPYDTKGDPIVERLNAVGLQVAKARGIPYVDLYSRVTAKCGAKYQTCPICAKDPCAYHYTAAGYDWIAAPLAAAILNATATA